MSYKRSVYDKRKIKNLYEKTKNSCLKGAFYDKYKGRYVRYGLSDNGKRFIRTLKSISNRKVRRTQNIFNRGQYKKIWPIKNLL